MSKVICKMCAIVIGPYLAHEAFQRCTQVSNVKSQVFRDKSQVKSQVIKGNSQVKSQVFQVKSQVLYVISRVKSQVVTHIKLFAMFGAFIHELCDAIMHKLNPPIEPSYLAPFPRYSLRWVQNRYILLPLLCLTPTSEGFPWDDHCEIFSGCQPMAKVPNAVEILRKI